MISQPQKLSITELHLASRILVHLFSILNSVYIVSGNNNLAIVEIFDNIFEALHIIFCGFLEGINDRVLYVVLLGKFGLFNDIGSSDQFGPELNAFSFGDFYLIVGPLNRPLQVVLNSGNDIDSVLIIPALHLLRYTLNSQLNIGLFGINQNP